MKKCEVCETQEKHEVLVRFMKEFFHWPSLRKAGFFTKEMKGDVHAQADRICRHFGFKTVYEYRATEIRCHLTEAKTPVSSEVDTGRPFVTVLPSIYD